MRATILIAALALTACASTKPSYQTGITVLQTSVPVIEAALATYPTANTPAIAKAETDLNAALAGLVAQPLPTNAAGVLAALQAVASALPVGVLSPAHQAEIGGAVAVARLVIAEVGAGA